MKFTIGTDPEFPLQIGGKYVSAIPYIKGTKKKPHNLNCGGTLQRDNVAVEFATAVAQSESDFVNKIQETLIETRSLLPENSMLLATPSAHFNRSELTHKEAQEIGCEPDYNAWTGEINEPPTKDFVAGTLRSFGAHIHTGHQSLLKGWAKKEMIQIQDYCVGMPSVQLDYSEEAKERRKLYGKAGAYRPTEYGVEYRTLSNFWLKSPDLVKLIYNLTHDSLSILNDGGFIHLMDAFPPIDVQTSINEGRIELAKEGYNRIKHLLTSKSRDLYDRCVKKINQYQLHEEWL
jgi:hypothetical protein